MTVPFRESCQRIKRAINTHKFLFLVFMQPRPSHFVDHCHEMKRKQNDGARHKSAESFTALFVYCAIRSNRRSLVFTSFDRDGSSVVHPKMFVVNSGYIAFWFLFPFCFLSEKLNAKREKVFTSCFYGRNFGTRFAIQVFYEIPWAPRGPLEVSSLRNRSLINCNTNHS